MASTMVGMITVVGLLQSTFEEILSNSNHDYNHYLPLLTNHYHTPIVLKFIKPIIIKHPLFDWLFYHPLLITFKKSIESPLIN